MPKRKAPKEEKDRDDEMEMELGDTEDVEMNEMDLNDELGLPTELLGMSMREKRNLYCFKQEHTAIEWEERLVELLEETQQQRDLEKLKSMQGGKAAAPASKENQERGIFDSSDEEDDDDDNEDEEADEDAAVEDDDDELADEYDSGDDLFDSDEEEYMDTQKMKTLGGAASKKAEKEAEKARKKAEKAQKKAEKDAAKADKKKSKKAKRSQLDNMDEEEDEEEQYEELGDYYDEDEDEDEDVAEKRRVREERRRQRAVELDDTPVAQLAQIWRVQSRQAWILANWQEPYFAKGIVGTFVRVQYQQATYEGGNNQARAYRMAEVLDVIPEGRSQYVLRNGEKCKVRLSVDFGSKTSANVKLLHVSNHRLTEEDFARYCDHRKDTQKPLWTEKSIEKKYSAFKTVVHHVYTHEEAKEMAKGKESLSVDTTTRLEKAKRFLARARQEGDVDAMNKLQKEIAQLEEDIRRRAQAFKAKYQAGVEINRRARQRNTESDFQASERKKAEAAEEDRMRAQGLDVSKKTNPFARRETRPKILWNTGDTLGEEEEDEETKKVREEQRKADAEAAEKAEQDAERQRRLADQAALEKARLTQGQIDITEVYSRVRGRFGFDVRQRGDDSDRTAEKAAAYIARLREALKVSGEVGSQERRAWHEERGTKSWRDSEVLQSAI